MSKHGKTLAIGIIGVIVLGAVAFLAFKPPLKPAESPLTETAASISDAQEKVSDAQEKVSEAQKSAPADAVAGRAAAVTTEEKPASAEPAPAAESVVAPQQQSLMAAALDVKAAMADRVMGNNDAPVTIIEYASMTCPHCAHFTTTIFPDFKKRLIDTGKVKYIFRDFPLDGTALKASMMQRCIAADKFFNLMEVVFSNQERWIAAKDPLEALAQLGALAGMDEEAFKSCTGNAELETALLGSVQDAQNKYHIKSTPTFIFNNGAEQLSGAVDVDKFEEITTKLTQGK
jgi:protein-disulfide isomerase